MGLSPDQLNFLRDIWTGTFVLATLVALWNWKEALVDYYGFRTTRNLGVKSPTLTALNISHRNSVYIQTIILAKSIAGLIAGMAARNSLPGVAILCLIAMGIGLLALTLLDASKRVRIDRTIRLARKDVPH